MHRRAKHKTVRLFGQRQDLRHRAAKHAFARLGASDNTELACYTGDSFRDLTRIARINDKMWAELFLWNKDNLISEIDMFTESLLNLREKLVRDDREGLEEMFRLSTARRAAFDKK